MSRGGICDARCQSFYTDMIRKEESLRIRWFLKNQQKLLDHLKGLESTKLERLPKHEPKQKQSCVDTIRLKPLPNWRSMEPDDTIAMDIMKPIEPQVRAILYEDEPSFITADHYFYQRLKKLPEARFYYPDCTSWVHGWRLGDYPSLPRSKVGRINLIKTEFYRANISSLQRDPEWYRPTQTTPTVCNEDVL